MFRLIILVLVLLQGMLCIAQRDSSLTDDFPKMSAKLRSKIAAKEQAEAANDAVFQELMRTAGDHFRNKEYRTALDVYRQARKRRPYNVHPKVKIHDLEALIAKEEAPKQPTPIETGPEPSSVPIKKAPATEPSPSPIKTGPPPDPIQVPEIKVEAERNADQPEEAKPRPVQKITPKRPAPVGPTPGKAERKPIEQHQDLPIGERIFKEGTAVVTERVIEIESRVQVWRKVSSSWGEVRYFVDGIPTTLRDWEEVFGDR